MWRTGFVAGEVMTDPASRFTYTISWLDEPLPFRIRCAEFAVEVRADSPEAGLVMARSLVADHLSEEPDVRPAGATPAERDAAIIADALHFIQAAPRDPAAPLLLGLLGGLIRTRVARGGTLDEVAAEWGLALAAVTALAEQSDPRPHSPGA